MIRYKISVEYKGTHYGGWQIQPNVNTIQQTLTDAINKLTNENVEVVRSGRTDAGVHAIQQVAHFDLSTIWKEYNLNHGINFYLKNSDIVVYNTEKICEWHTNDTNIFHARFSAKERQYVYKIINRTYPLTFNKDLYWWINKPLNIELMEKASKHLIGTNDLTSFRASGCQASSPIKTITNISINKHQDNINVFFTGPSFLYHQVRNIVGALVKVGYQNISVQQLKEILEKRDRNLAPSTAPAHGLYLKKITY